MSTSQHSKEFREKAVRLVLVHGKTAAEAAKELGIPDWKVRDWVRAVRRKESQLQDITGKTQAQEKC